MNKTGGHINRKFFDKLYDPNKVKGTPNQLINFPKS